MALIVEIKVVPSAGKNQWKLEGNRLKCYLKSPPEKGKANKELIALLSKRLKLPAASIAIISGATARIKRIKIDAELTFDRLIKMLDIEQQMKLF